MMYFTTEFYFFYIFDFYVIPGALYDENSDHIHLFDESVLNSFMCQIYSEVCLRRRNLQSDDDKSSMMMRNTTMTAMTMMR